MRKSLIVCMVASFTLMMLGMEALAYQPTHPQIPGFTEPYPRMSQAPGVPSVNPSAPNAVMPGLDPMVLNTLPPQARQAYLYSLQLNNAEPKEPQIQAETQQGMPEMGPATARTLQMLPPQARQAYLESMKFENTNVEPIIQPEETAPDQIASVSSVLKAPIMFEVPLKQTVEERTPQLTASNLSRNSIYSSSNPALANPFTYTGREDDGTGLMYYRGRYYDPKLEVFISQDIYGDAQRYANGNPLSYTDPMGWEAGYSYRAGPNGTEDPYTIPIDERSFSPQQQQCNRQCGLMALGLPVSGGVIVYGQPDLPTRGKFGNMTPGTSAISKAARRIPGKLPFQVPAPTAGNVGSRTASIGGAIGRWLPGIGYMGVPASLYAYSDCYERCMDDSNCGY